MEASPFFKLRRQADEATSCLEGETSYNESSLGEFMNIDMSLFLNALPSKQKEAPTPAEASREALTACAWGRMKDVLALCQSHPELLGCKEAKGLSGGQSLLYGALAAKKTDIFCALIERGAWPNANEIDEGSSKILGSIGEGDEALGRLWAVCLNLDSFDAVSRARVALELSGRQTPPWALWARMALAERKFALALDIFDHLHSAPQAEDLVLLTNERARPRGFWNQYERVANGSFHVIDQQLGRLEREVFERSSAPMPAQTIHEVWTRICGYGALDDARWMSSKDWLPKRWLCVNQKNRLVSLSLLEYAWSNQHRDLARALALIPQALEELVKHPPPPGRLKNFSASELIQLREWGVDIFAKNEKGQNFLHLWARQDHRAPRAGWSAMAKICPEALETPDVDGVTPVGAQMANLREGSSAQADFGRLCANISKRSLIQAAPAAKKKKAQSAPKRL
jgi:hypothetical protein